MQHLEEKWFKSSFEAHQKGIGNIFAFGSLALRKHYKDFYSKGLNKLEKFDRYYQSNPFTYQYDLLVYCWLNFKQILTDEVILLRKREKESSDSHFGSLAEEIMSSKTLYGIRREDFLYGACELRWPSMLMNGSYRGPLVRDPWMEDKAVAFSDDKYKSVIAFGGGGQGKTLTFLAFSLIIWDYFMFTQKGARCMISTVSKDKLNSASWSYLQQLMASTEEDISISAGQGVTAADWTIKRPGTKDVAGVFKGILLGDRIDDSAVIDKLTGTHGHPFVVYIMDEAQSTPDAPITSSSNYTMHAGDWRVILTGNYNEDHDTLGKNAKPSTGWDSVNESTKKWMSYMTNSQPAIVLHFSNNESPGMTEDGEVKFPYLPNRTKLKNLYPNKTSRSVDNKQYRRFWLGWRVTNAESDTVLTSKLVKETGCDRPVRMREVLHRFMVFDSAQGEGDRNILGSFVEGIEDDIRCFGADRILENLKTSDSLKYYTESANYLIKQAKSFGVSSGSLILDWTGRPAQAEIMAQANFSSVRFIFHQAVPDGKRKDPITNRRGRKILVNNDPSNLLYAHQVATNLMSLAAWLLKEYVQSGRIRGMNDNMLNEISNHGMDEEMYARKFHMKVSQQYGELFNLNRKKEFKNQYGFSPDLMDLWMMAAYYMFSERNLPISPVSEAESSAVNRDAELEMDEHRNLFTHDLLPEP